MTPPHMMPAEREKGRYIPTATGMTGTPRISMTMATKTPMKMRLHGSWAFMMPSTIIFIIIP